VTDGVPGPGDVGGDPEEVPGELQAGFWKTVVVLNVAGVGLALGAMLWVFERSRWALPVFGGGAVAAVHAYLLYRRYAPRHRDEPYD
jgi:hypothetical protein